ncbi:hypothetical protein CTI14_71530, partial [Methylobacterium radiotolerans]
ERRQRGLPPGRGGAPAAGARLRGDQRPLERDAVYLDRQNADSAAFRRDEAVRLPPGLDYAAISGLSNEMR